MQFEEIFPFVFPIFLISVWVMVSFFIALLGGWSRLAAHYRFQAEFTGKKWRFQSARFRLTGYNNCLTIGSNYYGLYLAMFLPFRIGHPPLLIPWSDITTTEHKGWLFSYLDFTFAKAPSIKLRVSRNLGDRIMSMRTDSFYNL